ncbi:MAG: hypothetical protein KDN19_11930 [Verrucomicrobiae bacterium]|nr:hypothetical protein [Verrucomicrobiae bacterium]
MRVVLALLSLFCATSSCVADMFPHWDVYWMCADADAVVVGEQLDGDKVTVKKWIKGADSDAPATIFIAGISKHSKSINAFWSRLGKQKATTLSTRHFVAFLVHEDGTWKSMATIEESDLCGSCGMIWIQDGRCYRYAQAMNPGPYDLYEATDLKSEADLMRAIEVGLRDADVWSKALNADDLALRAQMLSAYALASTSPENPRDTYRYRTREPLRNLGAVAVPALRSQISKWQEGDSLDEVVLILYDLGPVAQSAVPDLVTLLRQPERANPYYVISALRTTGTSSKIPDIKPFLKDPNEQVRREATDAIKALAEKEG